MGYRLTRKAADDLERLYVEGAETFGLRQAASYHRRLTDVFEMLAANPKLARLRPEMTPAVRVHPHRPHLIFYIEEPGGILIVRVRHGREDWAEGS
ncbi:MAG: type II toxin-antitoxin system RelE/ParE family toxin [Pseudomonadota bacterium]|nr:type II toxin-antitoxin system RelE/ParE family toxin [Pseudomonadota bacterium]